GGSFDKLKRGQTNITARLDLHGYTVDNAFGAVYDFIRKCHRNHQRSVIIITGKSGRIKQEFPRWINFPEIADMVLSFTTATLRDGGSGAYYVQLTKIR